MKKPKHTTLEALGFKLTEKHKDGSFTYSGNLTHSMRLREVNLHNSERVGLLMCNLIGQVVGCHNHRVYVQERGIRRYGSGCMYGTQVWIRRDFLQHLGWHVLNMEDPPSFAVPVSATWKAPMDAAGALGLLAHEFGHNLQRGGPPHGADFRAAAIKVGQEMKWALVRGWPKFDRRKFRPHGNSRKLQQTMAAGSSS
jgi:hypothetical protein